MLIKCGLDNCVGVAHDDVVFKYDKKHIPIKAFILKYKVSLRIEHTTPYLAVACKSKSKSKKILSIVGTL